MPESSIFSATSIAEAVRREVATSVPSDKTFAVVLAVDKRPGSQAAAQFGVAARVGDGWEIAMKAGVELDATPSPSVSVQVLYSR